MSDTFEGVRHHLDVPLLAAVLAAVALAFAASGCGGDTVALDPVAKAADTTARQTSEHVEVTGAGTGADGTRLSMNGSGDFQNDPRLGDMTMSFASSRGAGTIREIMKDWTVYMTSPLFAGQLPDGKVWMSLDLKKATKSVGIDITSFSGQSPTATLEQLKASGSVVRVGRATIDGVATTHWRATIDLSKVPNGDKIAKLTNVKYEPVDVWIGRDGLVRRVHVAYSAPLTGSLEMTMDFSRYGEPVYVAVPDDSVTFDATKATEKLLHG